MPNPNSVRADASFTEFRTGPGAGAGDCALAGEPNNSAAARGQLMLRTAARKCIRISAPALPSPGAQAGRSDSWLPGSRRRPGRARYRRAAIADGLYLAPKVLRR